MYFQKYCQPTCMLTNWDVINTNTLWVTMSHKTVVWWTNDNCCTFLDNVSLLFLWQMASLLETQQELRVRLRWLLLINIFFLCFVLVIIAALYWRDWSTTLRPNGLVCQATSPFKSMWQNQWLFCGTRYNFWCEKLCKKCSICRCWMLDCLRIVTGWPGSIPCVQMDWSWPNLGHLCIYYEPSCLWTCTIM